MTSIIQCQLCKSKEHIASACPRLTNLRPRCAKCGGGHQTNNCGIKCFLYSNMGHTKNRCWKKNDKGPSTSANFLEVLINDEEATLTELNRLCGIKHNFFWELECQNARCMYKHPHLDQKQKYLKRRIENLDTLGLMETSLLIYYHILLKGRYL